MRRCTIRRHVRSTRGFTLVELMISLVAGVVIAIGVMGLARNATTTFHEQVRISTVESSLRTASERLRNDLVRASLMSTGNIHSDTSIARIVGASTGARYANMTNLQGLHITVGGSAAGTQGTWGNQATKHGLNPDSAVITGNLTTDDNYRAQWIGVGACGGPRLVMKQTADAAVGRLLGGANPAASVAAAFQPKAGVNFWARIMDVRGCYHFVEVCAATYVAPDTANIDVQSVSGSDLGILTPDQTGNDNCGGREMEEFSISPVHRASWYIASNPNPGDTRLDPNTVIEPAANKFNLYRQLLDSTGTALNVNSPELVSEYAVDLKFGITVQNPTTNALTVYDMDSDPGGGSGNIDKSTGNVSAIAVGAIGPENVRSVRFRISVRSSIPDRTANLITVPSTPYIVRYCIENQTLANCKQYTRVRTLVSEVALLNQARMFY